MKVLRTRFTNRWLGPPGRDTSLPLIASTPEGAPATVLTSVWQPTDEERDMLHRGAVLRMNVIGEVHPPVTIEVVDLNEGQLT